MVTPESASAPAVASILFLRLPGGTRDALAPLVRAALGRWRKQPHLVLEGPDGIALVGPVTPWVAQQAARSALAARGRLDVGIGLHRAPVQRVRDADPARVAGEGLALAAALAKAADGIALSDDFRAALAQDRSTGSSRRQLLAAGGIVALLAAGWGGRLLRERYEAAHRPGVLVFDIRPAGEVFVDGEAKGSAPPLARLPLPPGPHVIEVRHPRARTLHLEVELEPGQEVPVRHVFALPPARRAPAPQPKKPGPLERFKFWK